MGRSRSRLRLRLSGMGVTTSSLVSVSPSSPFIMIFTGLQSSATLGISAHNFVYMKNHHIKKRKNYSNIFFTSHNILTLYCTGHWTVVDIVYLMDLSCTAMYAPHIAEQPFRCHRAAHYYITRCFHLGEHQNLMVSLGIG